MLRFRKFQAAGNDFIVLESSPAGLSVAQRRRLCDRHLGIGADGLVQVEAGVFHYWNADGQVGTFCGNGARVAAWLEYERTTAREFTLQAADGPHQVRILSLSPPPGSCFTAGACRAAVLSFGPLVCAYGFAASPCSDFF